MKERKKMCPAMTLIFECPLSLVARGELSQEQFWSLTSTGKKENNKVSSQPAAKYFLMIIIEGDKHLKVRALSIQGLRKLRCSCTILYLGT